MNNKKEKDLFVKEEIKKEKNAAIHFVDRHVGSRLRQLRRACGMSQDELAQAVGLTFQQVQKYEKGANRISSSKLYEFAKRLEVKVENFFQGLDENFIYAGKEYNNCSLGDAKADTKHFTKDNINSEADILIQKFKEIKDGKNRAMILDLAEQLRKIV